MPVLVRPFADADADAVAQLMNDSFRTFLGDRVGDPESPDDVRKTAHSSDARGMVTSFVAEVDGRVVGFLQARYLFAARLGCLESIGVRPDCLAAGVGRALFEAAEAFWKGKRARKVYTCVATINPRAQIFYLKMGFLPEGVQRAHYHPDVDEILLAKFYRYDDAL